MTLRKSTRQMIRDFNLAFERPVNDSVVSLTVTERELLGKLIFEECIEYVTLGLGLKLTYITESQGMIGLLPEMLDVELNEGQPYDPIESADGLGDMNVVIHFNSHWHGFNLDLVTEEIHYSNMSKLGEDGKPIINGETEGYRDSYALETNVDPAPMSVRESGFDPSRPIGKILKGPNYFKPNIAQVIGLDDADWYHKLIRL